MNDADRNNELKARAEKVINFSPKEISNITPEEIQRLFYDLQVYQIELQMQNEELQKTQVELSQSNNRLNFLYHHIPVGIVTLDFQGFIQQANHTFVQMVKISANQLVKKHFSKFVAEEDKNVLIHRYEPFFKSPANKFLKLSLICGHDKAFPVLIKANADDGSDELSGIVDLKQRKLVLAITDISSVINESEDN